MSWLRTAAREIFGLFVDDSRFALAILACLALAWLVLPRWPTLGASSGGLLFVALAVALVGSAVLRARR